MGDIWDEAKDYIRGNSDEDNAKAEMQTEAYRAEVAEVIDDGFNLLGGREKAVYTNEDGHAFVSVDMIYALGEAFAMEGMKAVLTGNQRASEVWVKVATLTNVLAVRAEDRSTSDYLNTL